MRLRRIAYAIPAVVGFVLATLVPDVHARVQIGGERLNAAVRDHLYWASAQAVATMLLLLPFALLAWWTERRDRGGRPWSSRLICASLLAGFVCFYWSAYHRVPGYLAKRMWTAASLTVGFLPFYACGFLVLIAVVDWCVRHLRGSRATAAASRGAAR